MKALAAILFVLTLAGCGGGGSHGPAALSPFMGAWNGPAADSGAVQGTMALVVGTDGRVSGTLTEPTATGTVSGTVNSSGAFTGAIVNSQLQQTWTLAGSVTKAASGHLDGSWQATQGTQVVGNLTFDLTAQ